MKTSGLASPDLVQLALARQSLTRSLFLRGTLVVLLGMLLISAAAVHSVSSSVKHNRDMQLQMGANMLLSLMGEELAARGATPSSVLPSCAQPLLSAEDRQAFSDFARGRLFRVWYGGRLCWRSRTGQEVPPPPASGAITGFSKWHQAGKTWRYYTLAGPSNGPVVQVGELASERQRTVLRVAMEMIAPFLLIALGLLVVLLFGLRTALRRLGAFGEELAMQNDRPPFRPIHPGDWPVELHPLVITVERLFQRIEASASRERRFIDMAAHQLRTPLAALSIEAQLAARSKPGPELAKRLVGLDTAMHRVSGLVDQLLALAQIDSGVSAPLKQLSARQAVAGIVTDIAPVAALREVDIAVEGGDLIIPGEANALYLLLVNLIDNAVKQAPEGSEVLIDILSEERRIVITDAGPGMTDLEKQMAFERFWKAQNSHRTGSGLGLAIAQEAANRLDLHLSLMDRPDGKNGLRAEIVAPKAS